MSLINPAPKTLKLNPLRPRRVEQERLMLEALEQLERAVKGSTSEFTYAYACGWAMSCLQRALGKSLDERLS